MVEVFKTNIEDSHQAIWLISKIHETFSHYRANFDLDDCDHILRVKCSEGLVEAQVLIRLLEKYDCTAKVLKDEINLHSGEEKILKKLFITPG